MSKSFKKLVAILSAIAMVIAGITVQPQTANAAEALEWSELTDGLGKATIKILPQKKYAEQNTKASRQIVHGVEIANGKDKPKLMM